MMKAIDEIMDCFNFGAVHAYMQETGWAWGHEEDGQWLFRVPDEPEIRQSARRLLMEAAKSPDDVPYIQTGGFTVIKCGNSLCLLFAPWSHDAEDS